MVSRRREASRSSAPETESGPEIEDSGSSATTTPDGEVPYAHRVYQDISRLWLYRSSLATHLQSETFRVARYIKAHISLASLLAMSYLNFRQFDPECIRLENIRYYAHRTHTGVLSEEPHDKLIMHPYLACSFGLPPKMDIRGTVELPPSITLGPDETEIECLRLGALL